MRMVWAANYLPSAPENMLLRAGSKGLQDGKKHTMEGVQPTPDVRECEDGADDVLCECAELGNCFRGRKDEEPAGGLKVAESFLAKEHRSDKGHSESCEDLINPGHQTGMSKEIMMAGIMEETEEDTFESMDDLEEMVKAADMELIKFCLKLQQEPLAKQLVM
ncbi:uncharacterized protein [Vulpes vulpes]|uniref:Uncharacterized protein isoform X1 n=1 Tax=Vulpes vulpes TaxID=9627 RepID=A0ABM4YGH3_VULVU